MDISRNLKVKGAIIFGHDNSQCKVVLIQRSYSVSSLSELKDESNSNGNKNQHDINEVSQISSQPKTLVKCRYHSCLNLDPYHAGFLTTIILQSKRFCKGFLEYSNKKCQNCTQPGINLNGLPDQLTKNVMVQRLVIVHLTPTDKEWIDYKWNYRVLDLVTKRIIADDAMAWLNTLGGGYSALGDYFEHHAEEAGKISGKQYKIALEMGDEPTQIRCRLYFSLSLMQRGYTTEAARLIRWQYALAKQLPIEDDRLIAMCTGIWSRLQYLQKQFKSSIKQT